MSARWRTALLWAALALAVAPAQAAEPWKAPNTDEWVEARSAHFTIYSNAGERVTRKSATELERFREALSRITTGLQLDLPVPTTIVIFRNEAMFRPYSLDEHGRPANVSGYFLPGPFRNYIVLDGSTGFSPLRVVFHEYVHAILSGTVGMLPLWLDEGLAQYFETFKIRAGLGYAEVGHPIPDNLDFMRNQAMLHWKDVFNITLDSTAYGHGLHQGAFYSQSWLLVHYLWSDPARAQSLARYLVLLRDGNDPDDAMKTALGLDRTTLADRAEAYRGGGVSPFALLKFGDQDEAPVTLREVQPPEVLFTLGDVLARQGQVQTARRHFDIARAAGWPPAPIETALGVGMLQGSDRPRTMEHFAKAVAADAPPVEAFVLLAGLHLDEALEKFMTSATLTPGVGVPADVLEARGLLERALQRDASDFHALVSLARTYLFGGDTTVGVAALEKARATRPLAPDVLRLGACLLARGGQIEEAWRKVQEEIAPRNEALAEESRSCIVMGTIEATQERLVAGDRPGARALMSDAMGVIDVPAHRKVLEPLHQMVASEAAITIQEPENVLRDRFAAAVALANSGDLERALERLRALRKECFGDDLCPSIQKASEQVSQAIARGKVMDLYNQAVGLANDRQHKAALALLEKIDAKAASPQMLERIEELKRSLGWRPPKK